MNEPLSIYIHIPFCVRKCSYCDFVSFPPSVCSEDVKDEYIDVLIRELSFYSEIAGRRIETAFVGGGTPSSLSASQLKRLLDGVNRHFDIGGEYSIEVNPATVDTEKLDIMRDFGINRISIGLQSIFDRELKLLGRAHNYGDFLRTLELVKKAGFGNINVDLMSALPGSDVKTWTKTLETVADMDVQHISAYSLIIEEGTPFGEIYGDANKPKYTSDGVWPGESHQDEGGSKYPDLPDEDIEREMYHITKDILSSRGFYQYEISNYAKSGFECRHNVKYWRGGYYIGAGLSASGHLPGDVFPGYPGEKHSVRYRNTADISRYLKGMREISLTTGDLYEETEFVTDSDFVRELFIFGLRMNEGVEVGRALDLTGDDAFIKKIRADIDRLKAENLIEENNGIISLTDRGRDFENYVVSFFV
ncbi:MAG: radical SAM family heme chaperone HemW [Lachnospiraceae bacterium]|nr:radical SAM family heme chaperone HemW [Lachnospiraceae bacterium]